MVGSHERGKRHSSMSGMQFSDEPKTVALHPREPAPDDAGSLMRSYSHAGPTDLLLEIGRIAHVGFWTRDLTSEVMHLSDEVFRIYGFFPCMAAARSGTTVPVDAVVERLHPADKPAVLSAIEKAVRSLGAFEIHHRILRADGSERLVVSRGEAVAGPDGRPVAVRGTLQDVTEQRRVEEELRYRAEFQRLIAQISTRFINLVADKIDGEIDRALAEIGVFAGVDRSYVFQFSEDRLTVSNTHEWCRPGVPSCKARLQKLPVESMPNAMKRHLKGEVVLIERMADLTPEWKQDKAEFKREGIQSLLCVPLNCAETVFGFVGFDSVRKEKKWPVDDVALLRLVGEAFANALVRRQTERRLRESEDRYRTVFHAAEDSMFLIDADEEDIIDANAAATRVYGFTREEFQRLRKVDLSAEPSRTRQTTAQRSRYVATRYHRKKDGSLFPVEVWSSCFRSRGRLLQMVSIEDLSERHRIEEAIRESRRTLQTLIDATEDTVMLLDTTGTIRVINLAGARHMSKTPPDVVGRRIEETFPLDQARAISRLVEEVIATGKPLRQEVERSDRWLEYDIHPADELAGKKVATVYIRDITTRRRAEEALRLSEQRFRAILDHSPTAIYLKDNEGRYVLVNRRFVESFGLDREPIGETAFAFQRRELAEAIRKQDRKVLTSGKPMTIEREMPHPNGEVRNEVSTKFPIFGPSGMVTGVGGITTDITDLKAAERKAHELEVALAHVSRLSTMGEMATGFAHELNQPLAAINNYVQGIIHRFAANDISREEMTSVLERVSQQARRAGDIIRRIRLFVRKEEPETAPMDLNAAIRDAVDLLNSEAPRHELTIDLHLDESLPAVEADAVQIQQVVLNLARNGIDAMDETQAETRRLTIRTGRHRDGVEVRVEDTGSGLTEEIRARLFEPFFTTKRTGMGMGLLICRSIIEAHGGRVSVSARGPRGAVSRFTLPTAQIRDGSRAR